MDPSCPFKEDCRPACNQWCDVLGFVSAGNVSSSWTLLIFQDASLLVIVVLPRQSICSSHFPWHVQDSRPTGVSEDGCRTLSHTNLVYFPFHVYLFTVAWTYLKSIQLFWCNACCVLCGETLVTCGSLLLVFVLSLLLVVATFLICSRCTRPLGNFDPPQTSVYCAFHLSTWSRTFFAPTLWNTLPKNIRFSQSASSLKTTLKTQLFPT